MRREKQLNRDRFTDAESADFEVIPSKITESRFTLSRQTIQNDNLIVQHDVLLPGELEHPASTHHFMALHITPSTRRIAQIGKEQYEGSMSMGEFCLHPSIYSGFYAWKSTDEIICFAIKPDWLFDVATKTECANPDKIELRPIVRDRDRQIEFIARSFLAEMQAKALGNKLYSETLGIQLAIHLLRNYCVFPLQLKEYKGGLSSRQLNSVIEYIDTHLDYSVALKDLAKVAQVNSSHYFCLLFKQSLGIPPYKYVIQQRIARAKKLLQQNNLPLTEVALRCGFGDQSALSRTFKKYVGTTPKKYRQQL